MLMTIKHHPELSEDLLAVLSAYSNLESTLGRGPSLRELLPHTHYADPSGVQQAVNKLAAHGLIRPRRVDPGGLTESGRALLSNGKTRKLKSVPK